MKFLAVLTLFACFSIGRGFAEAEADPIAHAHPAVSVQKVAVSKDERRTTFFFSPKDHAGLHKGLALILPGGDGGRDFLPFCSTLAANAFPKDWLAVQLVAPQWRPAAPEVTIWPSALVKDSKARFDTEDFIKAVIAEAQPKLEKSAPVVLLAWSSSGHAAISAVQKFPEIKGVLLAGSRFAPARAKSRSGLRDKAFFLYHGETDAVCPLADAIAAETFLPKAGARVKLVKFPGGHGWPPGIDHFGALRDGLAWMLEPPGARKP